MLPYSLSAKPWGHSPGISWEQRRRRFWMGSGDAAAYQSLGKGPWSWCTATGTGCRCADTSSLYPQKGSHPSEGWRPPLFPLHSQVLLRKINFLGKWQCFPQCIFVVLATLRRERKSSFISCCPAHVISHLLTILWIHAGPIDSRTFLVKPKQLCGDSEQLGHS